MTRTLRFVEYCAFVFFASGSLSVPSPPAMGLLPRRGFPRCKPHVCALANGLLVLLHGWWVRVTR